MPLRHGRMERRTLTNLSGDVLHLVLLLLVHERLADKFKIAHVSRDLRAAVLSCAQLWSVVQLETAGHFRAAKQIFTLSQECDLSVIVGTNETSRDGVQDLIAALFLPDNLRRMVKLRIEDCRESFAHLLAMGYTFPRLMEVCLCFDSSPPDFVLGVRTPSLVSLCISGLDCVDAQAILPASIIDINVAVPPSTGTFDSILCAALAQCTALRSLTFLGVGEQSALSSMSSPNNAPSVAPAIVSAHLDVVHLSGTKKPIVQLLRRLWRYPVLKIEVTLWSGDLELPANGPFDSLLDALMSGMTALNGFEYLSAAEGYGVRFMGICSRGTCSRDLVVETHDAAVPVHDIWGYLSERHGAQERVSSVLFHIDDQQVALYRNAFTSRPPRARDFTIRVECSENVTDGQVGQQLLQLATLSAVYMEGQYTSNSLLNSLNWLLMLVTSAIPVTVYLFRECIHDPDINTCASLQLELEAILATWQLSSWNVRWRDNKNSED